MVGEYFHETGSLSKKEMEAVRFVCWILSKRIGADQAISANIFVQRAKEYNGIKYHWLDEARLRKIINYIRRQKMMPMALIAGPKGYYQEPDVRKVEKYLRGLHERREALESTIKSFAPYVSRQMKI